MKRQLMKAMMTSISEVVETMFFLPAEQEKESTVLETGLLDQAEADVASAALAFTGDISGRLVMMVPGNLLSEMTENFMGESDDKLTRELKYGTLKELLNMVCGNALRKLDSGHGFDLGIPEIVDGETVPSELPAVVIDVADARIAAVLDIQN